MFVGRADGEAHAFATSLHNTLVAPARSVLVMVDPVAHAIEVVVGGYVRRTLTDASVELAVATMTSSFREDDLVGGLRRGIQHLAEHARPENTLHARAVVEVLRSEDERRSLETWSRSRQGPRTSDLTGVEARRGGLRTSTSGCRPHPSPGQPARGRRRRGPRARSGGRRGWRWRSRGRRYRREQLRRGQRLREDVLERDGGLVGAEGLPAGLDGVEVALRRTAPAPRPGRTA